MADEERKAAVLRFFRILADVQRSEGVKLARDDEFKRLCDSDELLLMTDDELRAKAWEFVRLETERVC